MKPLFNKSFRKDGSLFYECLTEDGEYHREDGPARIWYYDNGNISHEEYWLNGQLHREDGPAIVDYDTNRNIVAVRWYLYSASYSISAWLQHVSLSEDEKIMMWMEFS